MCELVFLPIFLEKDLLKVDKILGLTFFQARKDFEGFKTAFFHLLLFSFVVDGLFTTRVYSPRRGRFVNSAFPNKKNLAQQRSLFMTNKFESKCLQKFYVSSKHEEECFMKTTSYLEDFHLLLLSFVVDGLFITPVYSPRRGRFVNSAFPNKKNLAQQRILFMTKKFESKCLQKFSVSSKHEKECYMKTTSYLEEPNRLFCQHFMRRTTQQTFSAINLGSQQKTTKLYFSSQVRKQFKLLAVPLKPYDVVCAVIS